MPRIARVVAVGLPHHITQKGNYGQDIFFTSADRSRYFAWLNEYSTKYGLSILAYCLMRNHIHLIAIPNQLHSLAKTLDYTHSCYAQYLNKKSGQRGHLWQGRFYSCVLDQPHLMLAARYIERNPVRAGIARKPWDWPWSSAISHINQEEDVNIQLADLLKIIDMSSDSWREYIDYNEKADSLCPIRQCTLTGRPLGKRLFIEDLEKKYGRKLGALPKGRPKIHKKW